MSAQIIDSKAVVLEVRNGVKKRIKDCQFEGLSASGLVSKSWHWDSIATQAELLDLIQ